MACSVRFQGQWIADLEPRIPSKRIRNVSSDKENWKRVVQNLRDVSEEDLAIIFPQCADLRDRNYMR
jgi:hypothetical protein